MVAMIRAKTFYFPASKLFTTFVVLFFEQCKLFCVDWMNGCQITGENIYFPSVKLGLQHSPFYY